MPETTEKNRKNMPGSQQSSAGERAAKALLSVFAWIKKTFGPFLFSYGIKRPGGRVIRHQGRRLLTGSSLRFSKILVIEDNMQAANDIVSIIRQHYSCGAIDIYVAYEAPSAASFFDKENIDLVIMDYDLDDDHGDGVVLTGKFKAKKPGVVILANSNSVISNRKLEASGADGILSKSRRQLQNWLMINEPGAYQSPAEQPKKKDSMYRDY